ncbi:hypothetical protein ACGFOM_37905 [Streptomyces sp. NPDC048594]|uniref:hypothetical protein n=1 Tax=Streptomyces sp. NPDC048594 TaxID=3365575 RepID=UPI0037206000
MDFGEQTSPSTVGMRWYPRACPACTAARAHRGLLDHAPECEACQKAPTPGSPGLCETTHTLYRLVREARR